MATVIKAGCIKEQEMVFAQLFMKVFRPEIQQVLVIRVLVVY
jgi:hypothetical protein